MGGFIGYMRHCWYAFTCTGADIASDFDPFAVAGCNLFASSCRLTN